MNDKVWHIGLKYKFKLWGVPIYLYGILCSYLVERSFEVRINNSLSDVRSRRITPWIRLITTVIELLHARHATSNCRISSIVCRRYCGIRSRRRCNGSQEHPTGITGHHQSKLKRLEDITQHQ